MSNESERIAHLERAVEALTEKVGELEGDVRGASEWVARQEARAETDAEYAAEMLERDDGDTGWGRTPPLTTAQLHAIAHDAWKNMP